jgi:hypothetical protein
MGSVPKYGVWIATAVLILMAGCGGGGGGGGGGGSSTPSANIIAAPAQNVLPIAVNSGPAGHINLAYATITLCAPGATSNCQAIDNILIDTGSTGLRVMSSVLASSLSLPQKSDASGNPMVQCAQFATGFSWGPMKLADVRIAGEQASSLAIQVIGDPGFTAIPTECANTGAAKNTVQSFGANGVLGVGPFRQDCGIGCAQSASPGIYYVCPASGCRAAVVPLVDQLQNPVSKFAVHNNGIILELPSVGAVGAASVSGVMVFGIGTQANNGLGSASVLTLDPATGRLTTMYKNSSITNSFFDSGSNALFFQDPSIPACTNPAVAGFYCPASIQGLSAVIQGTNGNSAAVSFSVANADDLVTNNPGFTAFANLASPLFPFLGFDWGLPFFYGRNVFVAIDGANTPGGPGPYIAF